MKRNIIHFSEIQNRIDVAWNRVDELTISLKKEFALLATENDEAAAASLIEAPIYNLFAQVAHHFDLKDNMGTLFGNLGGWTAICRSEQPPVSRLEKLKTLAERYETLIALTRKTRGLPGDLAA